MISPQNASESPTTQAETVGPLSFAQQRLWFLCQLDPTNPTYNVPFAFRLSGELTQPCLEQALHFLTERHETLRTSFRTIDGQPAQVILPSVSVDLPLVDLSTGSPELNAEELRTLIADEAKRPFDLSNAPLLRTQLVRLSEQEHLLLVTLHHLVFDGWSVGIFYKELVSAYRTFSEGGVDLPDAPEVQYLDYTVWEREKLQDDEVNRLVQFWKQELQGAPALMELPTDHSRPKVQTNHGRCQTIDLPAELAADVREFCKREGVTLYSVAMAAFQTLLSRYSRQSDVVVGIPVANRSLTETQNLIGFFANTLPVRAQITETATFRELLQRVKQSTIKANSHQELPFEKLVEELAPNRNLSHNPIFQVLLSAYETPAPEVAGNLCFEFIDLETVTAKFDLTLFLIESADGVKVRFEYATDLFEAATIERMLGHFRTALAAAIRDPESRVAQLPLLTPHEHQQIVHDWNNTSVDYKQPQLVHALFEQQAAAHPDHVALRFRGESMTYGELNEKSNQVAHLLRSAGVGPDTFVGVATERSFEMVIALIAAMKAGGAYVPIDPSYPADRIAFMLNDAAAPVLLTQKALVETVRQSKAKVIALDDCAELRQQPATNPNVGITPDNLCYTIYTSGSTGAPKGAMNTHRGVSNRLLWGQAAYQITAQDKVLQKTPFSFDVSAWEFFWPLTAGAQLVIAEPGLQRDPAGIVDLVNREQVTIIHFVPSMLQAFLDEPRAATCTSIRKAYCSGEALPAVLQQRFFRTLQSELHNLYGPTEAAIEVTYWQCRRDDPSASVPIGWPIANARIYVLDALMQPVPVNVPGELHIGGVAVARGYHNREALTKERFVANPFCPGEMLYKTGDLAAFRPDGAVEYLGRLDHQIKIRGFRIELGEIESILTSHPAVKEAVVVARQDLRGDPRLVGYCVPRNGHEPSTDELKERLKQKVPDYMVPSAFVILPRLPLNANGKVDRKALPAPELKVATETYVAPSSETERTLVDIWADTLKVPRVGVQDNFFDLGGHSLLAMQVISRARTTFGVEIPLLAFFKEPTISALSRQIEKGAQMNPADQIHRRTESLLPTVDDLSDDQVEALLKELSR